MAVASPCWVSVSTSLAAASISCSSSSSSQSCFFGRKRFFGDGLGLRAKAVARRKRNGPVCMMLPSGKTVEKDKVPKWTSRSIKAFSMARLEARRMKYLNTGTEALLMGILTEGTSKASMYLRANGITLFKVRDESVNVVGKSDMFNFSPEEPPVTKNAQNALDWAVEEHQKRGFKGEISPTFMLLGIWHQKESTGHKILANLGFDDKKAEELLVAEKDE